MRIDRIRITSLASLHGAQPVVDLTGPLLGHAGLVAITGPTGSGKSTILDGLSLAIFGCTPRLGKDTDHLLSRDAVDGGAEVAFTLDDGSQWIASWHAHRSRKQLDGPVQAPVQQIARAGDGAIEASGIKDVRAWVERRLRLTFDQFRGVMLLAQFDFARFLVADDRDRSLLLEKLTGTDLYARLSAAAFERCRSAQERVQEHQLVLAGLTVLASDERAAVEAAIAADAIAAGAAETVWTAAQATVAWWLERHRRQDDSRQRDAAAGAAAGQWQDAGPERLRLAAAEAALQLHGELARLDESRLQAASGQQTVVERRRDHERSAAELQRRQLELAQTVAQLAAASGAAEVAAQAVAGLARLPDAALQPAREAQVQERERACQLGELSRILAERRSAALAAAAAVVAARGAEQASRQQQERAAAAHASAVAERTALLAGGDPAALGEQAALAREAGGVASALAGLDLAGATLGRTRAEAAVAATSAQALAAEQAAVLAAGQVELAERQRQQAESLAGLAGFVHLLADGQPCPLCGASEHPHPVVAGSAVVADAQAQLALAVRQRQAAEAAARQAMEAVQAARTTLAQQVATVERVGGERQRLQTRWSGLAASLPGLPAQPDPTATATLADTLAGRLAAARRCEATVTATQMAQRTADQALADSGRRLALAQAGQEQAEALIGDGAVALTAAEAGLAAAQAALATAVGALARQLAEPVPAAVGPWLEVLPERVAAARTLAEQARMLREAEADLAAPARARLPAGSIPALPPVAAPDPRLPIGVLRRAVEAHQAAQVAADQAGQALLAAERSVATAAATVAGHQTLLAGRLAVTAFADEAAVRAALLPPPELAALRLRIGQLQQAVAATRSEAERAALALAGHAAPAGLDASDPAGAATAETALAAAQVERDRVRDRLQRARQTLIDDDGRRLERSRIEAAAGPLLAAATQAATLSELIGSRDGARFRRFAQALTLDQLVVLANHRLGSLAPRYQLVRTRAVVGQDPSLGLEIIDQEQADAQRPVATLSGGETFLVSLALALALADLKRGGLRLGTLFIDEGFGSLDPATLERCLAILERLQQEQGTQIVVISHVGALSERLAHRIEVRPQGNGRSRLRISGPEGVDEGEAEAAPPVAAPPAVDPETVFAALPVDATAVSSRSLRKQLACGREAFRQAVARLVESGRIEQPPGSTSLRRRIP